MVLFKDSKTPLVSKGTSLMVQPGLFDLDNRLESLSRLGDPLLTLNKTIPWNTFRPTLTKALKKFRKNNAGRKPFDSILMFKILILQSLYNLSDDQTEYQIKDRLSFTRFLDLELEETIPDAKTLWTFRDTLSQKGAIEKLFKKFKLNNPRNSTEASRKAVNRILSNKNNGFAPVSKVKDLRPLYVQYLKDYDPDIKQQNGNQAIKNLLHHNKKSTSILYNDKFDIIKSFSESEFRKMRKPALKKLLNDNGFNKKNVKRFNTLKKPELIDLIKKNKISKKT